MLLYKEGVDVVFEGADDHLMESALYDGVNV